MAKESPQRRRFVIKRKQKTRKKIKKLKEKYLRAGTEKEREEIIKKILKIAPHYPIEEILKLKNGEKF